MRGKLRIIAAAASVCALVIVTALATSSLAGSGGGKTIRVIEHATTDTVVDTGAAGDTTGDLLTFANDVYDVTNTTVVGTDQGECVRIDPVAGSWECRWVTILEGGSISVEGPFYDTADSVLAITGGTGIFRNARGQMKLLSGDNPNEYKFIFRVIG